MPSRYKSIERMMGLLVKGVEITSRVADRRKSPRNWP